MEIIKENYNNFELECSEFRETFFIIFEPNAEDVLVVTKCRRKERVFDSGLKLTIDVSENGCIVKCGKRSKIASSEYDIHEVLREFAMKDVWKTRDIYKDEFADNYRDIDSIQFKFNTKYKGDQAE